MRAVFEDIATTEPETIRDAILRGLKAHPPKSLPYLQLAALYLDGPPAQAVDVSTTRPYQGWTEEQIRARLVELETRTAVDPPRQLKGR